MWKAWDSARTAKRHLKCARAVVAQGVTFRELQPADRAPVEQMVRAHILGCGDFRCGAQDGGVAALDRAGRVIAGLVAGAGQFDTDVVVFVRHLVVDPAWRGQGVGVVTLGVLPLVLTGQPVSCYLGNCAAADARFYQRAGYNVLDPGQPLPFPFGARAMMQLTSEHYPCWFFK